ncbi:transposase [Streptomyces sp. NBC_00252]|uniref:transposase n=1 Tax=Streptomyces sp. NBC_00252 TaxID=2975691 RepID=UPI003FA6935B
MHVITTAVNVNDITQTLDLVDGIPPVAGRPGRPRRRPESVLGDKAYDSKAVRRQLQHRRILPVISRKGARTSRAWASFATSGSRSTPCSTSSNPLPSERTPPRSPRCLGLVGLQPHLREAPQEGRIMIALRTLRTVREH